MQYRLSKKHNEDWKKPPDCLLSYHLQRALNDYFEEFKLPICSGYSARVVDVLTQRIERFNSLSVAEIATDLKVTTHTLHRRLTSEGCAFQHLYDQVRRHYAFYMLVNRTPISRIIEALQYTSKDSFEISFIRWTGLEPKAFQRLFCAVISENETPDK